MPSDATTSAYLQLAGSNLDALSAANANKKGRQWAEQQYNKQRADALADWHMQNDYNSPAAQMKRYTEGGLNPNLIYGSNQNGPVVRSTDTQSWTPTAPQTGRGLSQAANTLLQSNNLEMSQAQTDNIRAQNKNILLDSMLKAGQLQMLGTQTETSEFNLNQLKALANTSIEGAQVAVQKTKADLQYTLDQNERAASQNSLTLKQGLEQILNLRKNRQLTEAQISQTRQATANLAKDEQLKQLDINLKEKGVQPGDALWQRALAQLASGTSVDEILKHLPKGENVKIPQGYVPEPWKK